MAAIDPDSSSADAVGHEFLEVSRRQLRERLARIEACLDRLTPEQIWARDHEAENAVGNLVLHLAGNIRQWIVSGVGGEPDRRNRDAEFDRRDPLPADDLLSLLRQVVGDADCVLADLNAADLATKRKIQVYEVTVLHAVYHVICHLAEHTGQIIAATKRLTGRELGFYRYLTSESPEAKRRPNP